MMNLIMARDYFFDEKDRIRPSSVGRPFHLEDQGDPCRTGFSCGNGRKA